MPPLSDYRYLAEFRFQIRRFLHFSASMARNRGIEPQQHQLLLAVKGARAGTVTSIQYIARHLFIRHNSAVELVNRSARKGLVERRQDLTDLRRVAVVLTTKGDKVLRSLSEHHRDELVHAGGELLSALKPLLRGKERTRRSSKQRSRSGRSQKSRQAAAI